jgi:hypothetical protein
LCKNIAAFSKKLHHVLAYLIINSGSHSEQDIYIHPRYSLSSKGIPWKYPNVCFVLVSVCFVFQNRIEGFLDHHINKNFQAHMIE